MSTRHYRNDPSSEEQGEGAISAPSSSFELEDQLRSLLRSIVSEIVEEQSVEESKYLATHRPDQIRDRMIDVRHGKFPSMVDARERKAHENAERAALLLAGLVGKFNRKFNNMLLEYGKWCDKLRAATKASEIQQAMRKLREYETLLKKHVKETHRKGFLLGLASAGFGKDFHAARNLTAEEQRWLSTAAVHENKFLDKFLAELRSGKKAGGALTRAAMYGASLGSTFLSGQVIGTSKDTLIHWVVNPVAEHCPDCLYLQSISPFTKDTLPTTPRAGVCRCVYTEDSKVKTLRGDIPIKDIVIGDSVWTHRQRWRKVTCVQVTEVEADRQAILLKDGPSELGLTADHKVWTFDGWRKIVEVDKFGLSMIGTQDAKALFEMFSSAELASPYESLPTVRELLRMRDQERPKSKTMSILRDERQGSPAMGESGYQNENNEFYSFQSGKEENSLGGLDVRQLQYEETEGRSSVRLVLGYIGEEENGISLPLALDSNQRSGPGRNESSSQKRRSNRRFSREPGVDSSESAFKASSRSETRLDDGTETRKVRTKKNAPKAVPGLSNTIQTKKRRQEILFDSLLHEGWSWLGTEDVPVLQQRVSSKGENKKRKDGEILFKTVLHHGTKLYDLSVEEDHSFTVENRIVANCLSNCKCSLVYLPSTKQEADQVRSSKNKKLILDKIRRAQRLRKSPR